MPTNRKRFVKVIFFFNNEEAIASAAEKFQDALADGFDFWFKRDGNPTLVFMIHRGRLNAYRNQQDNERAREAVVSFASSNPFFSGEQAEEIFGSVTKDNIDENRYEATFLDHLPDELSPSEVEDILGFERRVPPKERPENRFGSTTSTGKKDNPRFSKKKPDDGNRL